MERLYTLKLTQHNAAEVLYREAVRRLAEQDHLSDREIEEIHLADSLIDVEIFKVRFDEDGIQSVEVIIAIPEEP